MNIDERVQRLEDINEITFVIHQAAWSMDYRKYDEWTDCFDVHGEWRYHNPDGTLRTHLKGHAELRDEVVTGDDRFPRFGLKHHVVNTLVQFDDAGALATSFFFTFVRLEDGGFLSRTSGRYFDRLMRCPDGRWRIAVREVRSDYGTPSVVASRPVDAGQDSGPSK